MISLIHFNEEDNGSSLGDMVYRQIKDSIINGELLPGDRLMELKLAEQMGVSRTPVRDAIKRLENEDMVVTVKDRGAKVASINAKDVKEATEMRIVLGQMCVRMAAENISDEYIRKMKDTNENFLRAAMAGDVRKLSLADNAFHRCICDATGSKIVHEITEVFEQKILRYKFEYLRMEKDYTSIYNEHRQLAETLAAGDADKAQDLIKAHVSRQNRIIE